MSHIILCHYWELCRLIKMYCWCIDKKGNYKIFDIEKIEKDKNIIIYLDEKIKKMYLETHNYGDSEKYEIIKCCSFISGLATKNDLIEYELKEENNFLKENYNMNTDIVLNIPKNNYMYGDDIIVALYKKIKMATILKYGVKVNSMDFEELKKWLRFNYGIKNFEELKKVLDKDLLRKGLLKNIPKEYIQESKKYKCDICTWFNIEALRKHNQEVEIENSKLKKAIEILKSKVTFWWRNDDILEIVKNPFLIKSPKIVIVTNYEEDKLLKEVLGNE